MSRHERRRPPLPARILRLLALGSLVAAVMKELRMPKGQRQWHGTVGPVPYDLRRPTASKMRRDWWRPEDRRLFVPRSFGVGWGLNLARLLRRTR